jgi:16S rRNA (cytosine967-C5)-methyltransferase
LLRLGLYQLFLIETPEHAAVYETVELASVRTRALVNAVLRNALRTKEALMGKARKEDLSIRSSHPQFLIDRWRQNFGAENTAALCEWNNRPAPIYARINRLKISEDEFQSGVGSARCADPVPQLPDSIPANFVHLTSVPNDALTDGHCYIQDPSTAAACILLDPMPGENILDACAAPGGKTGYLAELMKNQGAILACDRDEGRIRTLQDNLGRLGIAIARFARHDWTSGQPLPDAAAISPFDRILVDAPCSNTGVMRRRVDLRWRLTPRDFLRMREEQLGILRATISLLKTGGVLVYSTCSIEPEENEDVVDAITHELPFLKFVEQVSLLPFRNGFDGAFVAKLIRTT